MNDGFLSETGKVPVLLAPVHAGAGFFEDFAFAGSEALDAAGGDFIEDGIHFLLQVFVGAQIFIGGNVLGIP